MVIESSPTNKPSRCALSSSLPTGWISCQSIGANLLHCYQKAFGEDLEVIDFNRNFKANTQEAATLAEKLLAGNYTSLHFLDHEPHPVQLVSEILSRAAGRTLPRFCFHVYGDFTFYATDWMILGGLLAQVHAQVQFLCASSKEVALVQKFFESPNSFVSRFEYPLNTDFFRLKPGAKAACRAELRLEPDEFVLLYSGRISLQKNIDLALLAASRYLAKQDVRVNFLIAGHPDEIGATFFGVEATEGYTFSRIERVRKTVEGARFRVSYLGLLDNDELFRVYQAADLFVSLSLHHDEDYGMAVAEALACGLPCVLTDWGGYSDFATRNSSGNSGGNPRVHLVKVGQNRKGPFLFENALANAFAKAQSDVLDDRRKGDARTGCAVPNVSGLVDRLRSTMKADRFLPMSTPSATGIHFAHRVSLQDPRRGRFVFYGLRDSAYLKLYQPYYKSQESEGQSDARS